MNFSELLPGKTSSQPEDLACYGFDASGIEAKPSAVVWPESVEDVVRIVNYARAHSIPLIPRGAGTGMTGGSVPLTGSVVLSMERMNRILEIDSENHTVLVEPGVINGRLQRELERRGLFYPPDPASMNFCTIGGNVAENSGGPKAIKYGVTRDYVMGLEAVLTDGRVIHTGVRTAKGVVGYDLTRLLVGSEGTLAIITKIRLKVLPLPENIITFMALFGNLENCGATVNHVLGSGIIPRTLEFLDRGAIEAVEKYRPVGLPAGIEAILIIELDGHASAIKEVAEKIFKVCEKLGGEVVMAEDDYARQKIWEARRAVSPALYHLRPTKINEDIVVPKSRVFDMLKELNALSVKHRIEIVNFGHAGDGNIHVNLMVDRKESGQVEKARELIREIFMLTLEMGGTISGEHGVGLSKADYIGMEVPETELELMRKIKRVFDPENILNPGKIFPVSD